MAAESSSLELQTGLETWTGHRYKGGRKRPVIRLAMAKGVTVTQCGSYLEIVTVTHYQMVNLMKGKENKDRFTINHSLRQSLSNGLFFLLPAAGLLIG